MGIFLNTQTATSVSNIDPLDGHVVAHIVYGWLTTGEFRCRLTAPTHLPVGEAFGTAIDLTFDAICLAEVVALDKQMAALFLVDGEVTLLGAKREC